MARGGLDRCLDSRWSLDMTGRVPEVSIAEKVVLKRGRSEEKMMVSGGVVLKRGCFEEVEAGLEAVAEAEEEVDGGL